MDKKLSQLRDCFCQGSCKLTGHACEHCQQNDMEQTTAVLEAANNAAANQQCSPDHCWECSNTLC